MALGTILYLTVIVLASLSTATTVIGLALPVTESIKVTERSATSRVLVKS
jgi:hypothetical protein